MGLPVRSRKRSSRWNLPEGIRDSILLFRGQKVLLDSRLAVLYGVETRALIQAVKRNRSRFPMDFMFQMTWKEAESLRSQFVILKNDAGGALPGGSRPGPRGRHIKYRPYAFTEQGVAMLSSVLRSERAIQVNIEIMRAFVLLRGILASHATLSRRLASLENKYDSRFRIVFEAIRRLMETAPSPEKEPGPEKRIGFRTRGERDPPADRPIARSPIGQRGRAARSRRIQAP